MNAAFYRRLPKINPIPVGSGNDADEESYLKMLDKEFCKRCGYKLIFRDDLRSKFCCRCAWSPPPTEEGEENDEEEKANTE